MFARLVGFSSSTRVQVERIRDVAVSPDNRFLALRTVDNVLSLLSVVNRVGSFVSGFQATGVLFYDFVFVGRPLLVAVNGHGTVCLYEYLSGQGGGGKGFYVRVVSKKSVDSSLALDPVLARFDSEASRHDEDEETISCWEVSLERIGLLMKKEKILSVQQLRCSSRHVAMVLRSSKNVSFAVVLDVTPGMVALRRWWPLADGSSLDDEWEVATGKREQVGVTDLGPRSLGTDAVIEISVDDEKAQQQLLPQQWIPPVIAAPPSSSDMLPKFVRPPAGMIETTCEAGRKRIWIGSDGIFLPDVDRQNCLKATLIFEGPEAAFQLASVNKWDTAEIRLFALELAFKHGDADGARVALQELPRSLRPRAHELAGSSGPMKWELLREWSAACAHWAVEDGDEEAASAVKRARLLSTAAMSAAAVPVPPPQGASAAKRGLKFEDGSPTKLGVVAESWKPKKELRKAWDGLADEEVVRLACLQGSLGQALGYLRWRNGVVPSIVELAKEAAYRTLCMGNLSEASIMLANAGALHVEEELEWIRLHTLRPSVRTTTGGYKLTDEPDRLLALLSKYYRCVGGPVDDFVQLSRWVPEDLDDQDSRPYLRTSIAWVAEWGREGARDVLLEAALSSSHSGNAVEIPGAPDWDPLNARALSFFVRHGDERGARKLCAKFSREDEALLKQSLLGAAPHAQTAVLWELAKNGVHPFGLNHKIACATGSLLKLRETSSAAVATAMKLRRPTMLHCLMDAGADAPDGVGGNAWNDLALLMRSERVNVAEAGRLCALVLHSSAFSDGVMDLQSLGRPLISVPYTLCLNEKPSVEELAMLGCDSLWDPLVGANVVSSPGKVQALLPVVPQRSGAGQAYHVSRPASMKQWLRRGMPFRASDATDANGDLAAILAQEFPKHPVEPIKDDWVQELLESSLDPSRPVFPVNRHIAMVINNQALDGVSCVDSEVISTHSSLSLSFKRAWEQLRLRHGLADLLAASNPSDEFVEELIQRTLPSSWDTSKLLGALVEWKPDRYSCLLANWTVIGTYNLDVSLLRCSASEVCEALQARGLWDAAREHSPERRHQTTLAQAERKQPQWQKIVTLFEEQSLPPPMREDFWLRRADEFDSSLDLTLLACAKQSSESAEIEARWTIAELGGWSWKKYQAASAADRESLLTSITGSLASFGEMHRVSQLCKTLKVTPEPVLIAQRGGVRSADDLQPFLDGKFGPGWTYWAQGKILRLRAMVDDSQPAAVVIATLAGEGQVALAKEWAAHFKPDAPKLSRVLGQRYVEVLRRQYPSSILPSAAVSLASPSSRGGQTAPGIDVGWSDGAWADYVAVGGSPRDVGDVLFEALTGDSAMVVRQVELCIRAHSCYAMACYVEGMDQVLNVAVSLAETLSENGLYAHLIRLVTGVGNYVRLEFIFGILMDAEQFELILRKNPMMSFGARLELRQALYRFLKDKRPDSHSMNLLLLSFGMFSEIGAAQEDKAQSLIKLGRGRASMLVLAFSHLIDAADAYHKDKCLQSAERALRLANLVKLQIQRPALRLLYENGADIGKLTLFSEACTVAKALKLGQDWWIAATYEQGIVGGNAVYLDTALAKQSQIAPMSSVYHDLLLYCKRNNATTQTMSMILLKSPDVFLAFDLAIEFKLDQVADQLASKSSAIRCFKLLQKK